MNNKHTNCNQPITVDLIDQCHYVFGSDITSEVGVKSEGLAQGRLMEELARMRGISRKQLVLLYVQSPIKVQISAPNC